VDDAGDVGRITSLVALSQGFIAASVEAVFR
jgi:hypothetical protein